MANILVTGGNGSLGQQIVAQLLEKNHRVRVMSRKPAPANLTTGLEWAQAELKTGLGLTEALQDIDVIVHAASSPAKSRQVDIEGTGNLLEKARQAGVKQIVYISIVGIDRIPYSYYRNKLACEELIKTSGLAWSILRATQFHTLLDLAFKFLTKLPLVVVVPRGFKFQPIDPAEVATRLVELVEKGPAGQVADLGGPQVLLIEDMLRSWLKRRGKKRFVLALPLPGKLAKAFRAGYNTCQDQPQRGQITWDDWLQKTYEPDK
jgi:uncharacterized protein YbjT (DUF2867 family)